jgi:protein-disulfide isomerase
LARQLGVNATPTIFINGRRMVGAPGTEALEMIIKKELGL